MGHTLHKEVNMLCIRSGSRYISSPTSWKGPDKNSTSNTNHDKLCQPLYASQTNHQSLSWLAAIPCDAAPLRDRDSSLPCLHAWNKLVILIRSNNKRFQYITLVHKCTTVIPVMCMMSRKSGHKIFGLGKRNFTKPLMVKSLLSCYPLHILQNFLYDVNQQMIEYLSPYAIIL